MKKSKVFAEGFCFKKVFIFFVIGCLFGTYYEEILWFVKHGVWTNRDGVLYGPFSPIYGLGVLIFVALLGKNNDKRSIFKTFLLSFFLGGFTEYLTSFIADTIFGVEFWDYSNLFLNINGRTTIPYMVAWGVMGTVLMKLIYPLVSHLIEKIPQKIGNVLYYIVFVLLMIDIVLTYTALGRMALRNEGVKAYTFIGELYDKYYPNEYLYQKFPLMRPEEKSEEPEKVVWNGSTLIGHAFYEVDGISYTNSKEAFFNGYEKGIRTFEVDFQFTSDHQVVLMHDWKQWGYTSVPTKDEFLKSKVGNYTTMSFEDLLELLKEYPDIFIMTDSKYTDNDMVKEEFEAMYDVAKNKDALDLLERFIIQIYHEDMYDIVEAIYPFQNIIFTMYQRWDGKDLVELEKICDWSQNHAIKGITMWNTWANDNVYELMKTYSLDLYVHTENNVTEAKRFLNEGVKGIYTDSISLNDLE